MVKGLVKSCKKNQSTVSNTSFDTLGRARALYVHVPFCLSKCRYCDFYSSAGDPEAMDAYVEAILVERRLREDQLSPPLQSLYFGGGTPTVLGPRRLSRLLGELTSLTDAEAEISVEANPGTVTADVAAALMEGGANRVTLGAQSFNDGELAFLGRIHRAGDIADAAAILRAKGVGTLAIDLIYAIPGQTPASWRKSLIAAVALNPQHVSCYALSFEDGTSLGNDLRSGLIEEVNDELQRDMYDQAVEFLRTAGYEHYELSNFAQPGRRCRHNLVYWRNQPYLGLGPGACSYVHEIRRTNLPDRSVYNKSLISSTPSLPPSQEEYLTGKAAMAEMLMLSLRLIEGVEIHPFVRRYGVSPTEAFSETFQRYCNQGAVEITPTHVRLHRDALFTANCVLGDLLAECD